MFDQQARPAHAHTASSPPAVAFRDAGALLQVYIDAQPHSYADHSAVHIPHCSLAVLTLETMHDAASPGLLVTLQALEELLQQTHRTGP